MKIINLTIIILVLSVLLNPLNGQTPQVSNPYRDWGAYFKNKTFQNLIAIVMNRVWSMLAPWVGGYTMVYAFDAFQQNPGLYNFLGYTVHDFYVMGMHE